MLIIKKGKSAQYHKMSFMNEANFSTRLKNKISSNNKSNLNHHISLTHNEGSGLGNASHLNSYGQRFLRFYLTKSSLAYHRDPNCRLANIIRHYLYYFEDELKADLASPTIPEIKYLKRGINEVLNSWTTSIMNYLCDYNDQDKVCLFKSKYYIS